MSDCVLFATLFAVYAVLHNSTFGNADSADLFSLPYVFIETLVLLTSSFTIGLAALAAYQNKTMLARLALSATLLLGVVFLAMEISEFHQFLIDGHSWRESAFLSSFFALVGTHGFHVLLGSIWILTVAVHTAYFGLTDATKRKILIVSLFWHFLDIVWIFIFSYVYLWGMM
jgi:cytochrome o ubiquinol oxidase subunit 3